jgi:CHAT domain-containing protein
MFGQPTKVLSGEGRAKALQRVQLDLLKGATVETRHPYYWAAFVLIGDWRGIR